MRRLVPIAVMQCGCLLLLTTCGTDNVVTPPPGFVKVAGVVRNIDTGEFAVGARVSQLGTTYRSIYPTGDDGYYELIVPEGTELQLLTDDFRSTDDVWIPLINVDSPGVIAERTIPDWPIHTCPWTSCTDPEGPNAEGSLAAWSAYLESGDQNNGDIFVPTDLRDTGGIIAYSLGDCTEWDSVSVTTDAPEFPVAYPIKEKMFGDEPSCVAGPGFFYPPSRTMSDEAGWALSIGDPAYTDSTVTVTFTDMKAVPYRNTPSPVVVPVRHGTLTLVWAITLDGEPATFKEFMCECVGDDRFCTR